MNIKEEDVQIIVYPKKNISIRFVYLEELIDSPLYKSSIMSRYKKFPSNILKSCEPSHMIICVCGEYYSIDIDENIIWDGVTSPVNIGDVVRVSADTLVPSLYHDGTYASKFFSRQVCDIIFKKLIDYCMQYPEKSFIRKLVKKISRFFLVSFSRLFGGFIYNRIKPEELYINEFIKITRMNFDDVRHELDRIRSR